MNKYDFEMAKRHGLSMGNVFNSHGVGFLPSGDKNRAYEKRAELFGDAKYLLCFIGELSKRKNQRFLIECMPLLASALSDIKLCLVGDGAETPRLKRLAGKLGVGDKVIFMGYRDDARDFAEMCDLYVSASSVEGLPLNVMEAMSLGKTVLISGIKGHTDLVSDGISGYLYTFGNHNEFIEKACRILRCGGIPPENAERVGMSYRRETVLPKIMKILYEEL